MFAPLPSDPIVHCRLRSTNGRLEIILPAGARTRQRRFLVWQQEGQIQCYTRDANLVMAVAKSAAVMTRVSLRQGTN